MSMSHWDRLSASAEGLITEEQCYLLLDSDFFDTDDLLKSFPSVAPKTEVVPFHLHDDVSASMYPPSPPEIKPSRAELANDLLQQLDNQCKQENIFPNWLEEKVELPIFDSIPERGSPVPVPVPVAVPAPPVAVPVPGSFPGAHTEALLREFEHVYDAVELTHLTPPQSPPGPATQLLLSYAQQAAAQDPWPVYDTDLASVDELVRNRAAQLVSPGPSASSSSPPSSPRSTDEEWAGARRKPYARCGDDRRSRKKEQNKNAATRYRQKKKAEVEVLLTEEQKLRQTHSALGEQCCDLQREIRYLKGLMRDLFKAKGLIK